MGEHPDQRRAARGQIDQLTTKPRFRIRPRIGFASSAFVSGRRSSLTAATLPLWISSCLLLGVEDEVFGLEIVRTSGLGPGTIYPILQRLLSAGWC